MLRIHRAFPLGQCYWNEDDQQKLRYVRFAEAVKEGASLTTKLPMGTEDNIAAVAPVGSTKVTVLASTVVAAASLLTAESKLGFIDKDPTTREYDYDPSSRAHAIVHVHTGTGADQFGVITDYNTHDITVRWDTEDGTLETALALDSDLTWVAPWLMEETDASTEEINGFAQLAATKGQYGLILEEGLGKVLVATGTLAGQELASTGTAGTVAYIGTVANIGAIRKHLSARALFAPATAGVIYANVYANPIGKVPRLTTPHNRGTTRPGEFTGSL